MPALNIAAIQTDIRWLEKAANLALLDHQLESLQPCDLLLLPETFSTGFSIDVSDCEEPVEASTVLDWMKTKAAEKNCVIAGSVLVKYQQKKANRFYWVWPDGNVQYYDKRHLFRLGNEQDYVEAGTRRTIIQINGVRILPQVCYDLRFPVWSRNRNDYDLLVNVANWPAARRLVWDTLLAARAMENQAFVIGVNRIGVDGKGIAHNGGTVILNYRGEPLARAEDDRHEIIYASIDVNALATFKSQFPAYLDADNFQLLTSQ